MMIISTKVLIMVSTAAATITASFLSMGLDIKPSPFDTARAAESDKEQLMASYHSRRRGKIIFRRFAHGAQRAAPRNQIRAASLPRPPAEIFRGDFFAEITLEFFRESLPCKNREITLADMFFHRRKKHLRQPNIQEGTYHFFFAMLRFVFTFGGAAR